MHALFQKKTLLDLEYHLNSTQNALDVVAITGTRTIKNKLPANDINLTNQTEFQFYTQDVICYINQKMTCASAKLLN